MINQTRIIDYTLIFLLVAFSGIPFFYRAHVLMLALSFLLPLSVFIYRKRKIDKFVIYYIVFALLIQAGQMLKFYYFPVQTFLGLHLRILFAYFSLTAIGIRSIEYYINLMMVFVMSSVIIYLSTYVGIIEYHWIHSVAPYFDNPLITDRTYHFWPNVILYTFNSQGEGLLFLKRNSGPFWEPGAFAGFLILALLFNIIRKGRLNNKTNWVLVLGLISTFSTSGYIALAFVMLSYFIAQQNIVRKAIYVPLILLVSISLYFSVDFIGDKIQRKLAFTNITYNTRFKSAMIDFEDFMDNPFVGMGRSQKTRFKGETKGRVIHRNNGVTNFLAMYGLFAFILYFALIYKSFKFMCHRYNRPLKFAFLSLIAVFIIGFAEVYFTRVFFFALTMIHLLYSTQYGKSVVVEQKVTEVEL